MRSSDIINLYNIVGWGAKVTIVDAPLASAIPTAAPPAQLAATNQPTTGTIR
jgi:hypothetical protein